MANVIRPTFLGSTRHTQLELGAAYGRLLDQSDKVASNKAFRRPSEAPVESSHAAMLQEHLDHLDAVGKSADDAMARLNVADSKLTQASDLYARLKELIVQAADTTQAGQGRAAIAQEVSQIRDSLVAVANSDYLGQPLFSGTSSDPAVAYDDVAGQWVFTGSADDKVERRVSPTESIRVNVSAAEAFQADGTDLFTMLDGLVNALGTDDQAGIQTANGTIDAMRSSLSAAHAVIGAAANRVQTSIDRNGGTSTVVANQLSLVRDIDLADAITQQKTLEVAYQAALAATAKVGNLSLLDYIR